MDLDPDPAIFVIDLQDANKKEFLKKVSCLYYFLKVQSHHFSNKKSKRSQKREGIKVFLTFFA
jgi:hypothetical protein